MLKLRATELREEARAVTQKRKRAFCLKREALHRPDLQGSAKQGWESGHRAWFLATNPRLPPWYPLASSSHSCSALELLLCRLHLCHRGVLRPAWPPQCKDFSWLGQLSSERSRSASSRNLSCYFVALQPSGQAAPPNTSVPWETPFQQKKREKEKEVP